ncbi:MAG: PEP-CTERM sorting domain-containing protein [Alphaproteobacteria bacterium]
MPEPATVIIFMMSLALLIYMRRRSSNIPANSLPIPA